MVALGVMRACIDLGLRIQEEVSLIGFDEYPYTQLLSPRLSTIAQPTEDIGDAASTMLLDWLESGKTPENMTAVLDTQLVCRTSVGNLN